MVGIQMTHLSGARRMYGFLISAAPCQATQFVFVNYCETERLARYGSLKKKKNLNAFAGLRNCLKLRV